MRCSGRAKFRTRTAFTLIELMAVLLVLGLLASAVVLSLGQARRVAQLSDAVEQWRFADQQARQHARRLNRPLQLLVNLDAGSLQLHDPQQAQAQLPLTKLPRSARVEQLRLPTGELRVGQAAIACGPGGWTSSYAVCLADARGQRRWLVVAGLSGKAIEVEHEREVQELFAKLAALRPDAH